MWILFMDFLFLKSTNRSSKLNYKCTVVHSYCKHLSMLKSVEHWSAKWLSRWRPGDLSPILGTCKVEGENQLCVCVCTRACVCVCVRVYVRVCSWNKVKMHSSQQSNFSSQRAHPHSKTAFEVSLPHHTHTEAGRTRLSWDMSGSCPRSPGWRQGALFQQPRLQADELSLPWVPCHIQGLGLYLKKTKLERAPRLRAHTAAEEQSSAPSTLAGTALNCVTPAPRNRTSSFGLYEHCTHEHIPTHRHTHTYILR